MRLPTLFRQNSNKRFDYQPRYYDERKERIEKLREKYNLKEGEVPRLGKSDLRDQWYKNRNTTTERNSSIRLVIIMIILFALAYGIINYFKIPFLE